MAGRHSDSAIRVNASDTLKLVRTAGRARSKAPFYWYERPPRTGRPFCQLTRLPCEPRGFPTPISTSVLLRRSTNLLLRPQHEHRAPAPTRDRELPRNRRRAVHLQRLDLLRT